MKKVAAPKRKTEPITFEILRHRLQSAVEEAAVTLKNVSGSPVATEIGDMNLAIMDRDGKCISVGQYTVCKGTSLAKVAQDVLANYKENPGIFDGDAFICNDPYIGVMHQNDVAVVEPYYKDGELLAWVGAEVHQIDVGGPCPGQVQLGAKSIFGEAPWMPPMKLMRNGEILADVERNYLAKSRVPDLVALDLRAKIAACNSLKKSLDNVVAQLGNQGLVDFMEDMCNDAEYLMRKMLVKIPNGTWHSRGFLEFEDDIYPVEIHLTKKDDHMIFDYHGTAKQAPATINMTKNAVAGWISAAVVSGLCWNIPWTIAGIERTYTIVSEPGTLVNPTFPAGVSKSSTSVGLLQTTILHSAMSKMLQSSQEYADRAMAAWPGSKSQEELNGINQYGDVFGADILDGMAGGGGARTYKDGVDTGGLEGAPRVAISNVEEYEQQYPLLYLYRREYPDSGGIGKYRGGNGLDRMYVVHDKDKIDNVIMHSMGAQVPTTSGLAGGHPSATNLFAVQRKADIEELFKKGVLPTTFEEMGGETEIHAAMSETSLSLGDAYRTICNGGGGYGDALDRTYDLIEKDVQNGCVSKEAAEKFYGAVFTAEGTVDTQKSDALRESMREERLKEATKPENLPDQVSLVEEKFRVQKTVIGGIGSDEKEHIFCRCGCNLGGKEDGYVKNLAYIDAPFIKAGAHIDPYNQSGGKFFIRMRYCPKCGLEINSETMMKGLEPLPEDSIEF
ncbi:MAG: hydantoinase B/oxoprolinase family protein [Lachnospiraceae bacterium]|nr:hydantoinase B/oxoprolinase family protein [Lachnospiraceae bacterium]